MYSWKCGGHGPTSLDMVKGEILSSLHLQSKVWKVAVSHWHYGPPPNSFPPRRLPTLVNVNVSTFWGPTSSITPDLEETPQIGYLGHMGTSSSKWIKTTKRRTPDQTGKLPLCTNDPGDTPWIGYLAGSRVDPPMPDNL